MKTLTMITRHGISKEEISGYTLITGDYQTIQMGTQELIKAINEKKVEVTNLKVGPKGIESTNGAIDKYTLISSQTNQVIGQARAVILDRVEQNDKLVGYTIFMQTGALAEVNVIDAAAFANKGLISNGKIRHTSDGDIVSAIGGNYPLRIIDINKSPKGETSIDILYFGTVIGVPTEYFGAIISCTSATEMSKLTDILSKSNAKVVSEVVKVAGQSARESLSIKRMGVNSLYGVFDIALLSKMLKSGAKLQNKLGKIIISAIKYTNEEPDEATVKLSHDWNIVDSDFNGSASADKLKQYAKKIVLAYNNVSIK